MKDLLKMLLLLVGTVLFSAGVVVAYRDAALDYHMGPWGVLGSVCAGLGVLALAFRREV